MISTKPKDPPKVDSDRPGAQGHSCLRRSGAIRRDIPDFVAFMLATGLRFTEAAAAVLGDVDLKTSHCCRSGERRAGEGDRPGLPGGRVEQAHRPGRSSFPSGRPSFSSDGMTQKPALRLVRFSGPKGVD